MFGKFRNKFLLILFLLVLIQQVALKSDSALAGEKALAWAREFPGMEDGRRALLDRLYYREEKWMPLFRDRIAQLELRVSDIPTKIELMMFHLYLAAVNVEKAYSLGLTRQFRFEENEAEYRLNVEKAKQIAKSLLKNQRLSPRQRAVTYLFLGGSVGYIGKYEFGVGNLYKAFVNGFRADTYLEKALNLAPSLADAHIGLGMYRYVNSRLGGIGNLIMQWGKDRREVGIGHLKHAIESEAFADPIAYQALILFYISEQMNNKNRGLSAHHPLSLKTCRANALKWIEEYENRYLKGKTRGGDFIGNKALAMMKAIHYSINGDYVRAGEEYKKNLHIINFLHKTKGYKFNPRLIRTITAGIEYCELMLLRSAGKTRRSVCAKIGRNLHFLKSGKMMIESDFANIGEELADIYHSKLAGFSHDLACSAKGRN